MTVTFEWYAAAVIALAILSAGYFIGWYSRGRAARKNPPHRHTWSKWETAEATKHYVRGGQQFDIDVSVQYRDCQSCGLTETRDFA